LGFGIGFFLFRGKFKFQLEALTMNNKTKKQLSDLAIQARRRYYRAWYKKNKKRAQETQERFFLKKAEEFGLIENSENGKDD